MDEPKPMRIAPLLLTLSTLLFSALSVAELRVVDVEELEASAAQRRAATLVTQFLTRHHYRKAPLDDQLSTEILDRYLEALDPSRSFLLASDVQAMSEYRDRLDDLLRRADVSPAFEIFKTFRERAEQRSAMARELLQEDFDFSLDEDYQFDRSEAPWAASEAELDDIWRRRVKHDFLSQRLAGKTDEEIRELLDERYQRLARGVQQLNTDDVFQLYMSAYGRAIEPHTSYLSPRSSENFRIRMSLSLEGIGAALQTEDEYTVVRSIIPGGPADLDKRLQLEDRIVGVAQADGPMVDVVSWRLEDVVDLIRGKKGTSVRLAVLPKGATPQGKSHTVELVRDTVKLEEQAARLSIIEDLPEAPGKRIGVIELPTFYLDIDARARGDADYRSTTRDVRRLLGELQDEGVDGVIMDLRGNSGGSLVEATDLTGLFIDTGPVVQIRYANGRIQVNSDEERGLAYDGPLAVLVDRFSASASEIFAGAIQDHRRGLVIGEPTFGKGTVQHLVPLDRYADAGVDGLGHLKMTVAKFFRISGDSTQHRGVIPDILFPTALGAESVGERALDNALEWSRTTPAYYTPLGFNPRLIDNLRLRHEDRVAADPHFDLLVAEARSLKQSSERKSVTLNEAQRKAEQSEQESELLQRENTLRALKGLPPRDPEARPDPSDIAALEQREAEEEILGDALLEETARILIDSLDARTLQTVDVSSLGTRCSSSLLGQPC